MEKSALEEKGSALSLPELPRGGSKKMYTTWTDMARHWPKTSFCILANEFCERFSYYGMSTVLPFYFLNVLKVSDNASTIFFNSFSAFCFLTPIFGSILADGYMGKFWTIFSVSIVYAIGQITVAVSSSQRSQSSIHPYLDFAGLLIIAIGTGGIKPCVSAFGADQFEKGQARMQSVYFSVFYFSINFGSMISSFISPIFRSQSCLGQDSCYPLAFGVPAVLMLVATGVFMTGSFWYKKPKPTENVIGEVARVIGGAVSNKFSSKNAGPTEHWLDHYMDTHDCDLDPRCVALKHSRKENKCQKASFVSDIKGLLRVVVMFLPVPMFWALYDQQSSVWLLQGIEMNCNVFGSYLLLPDQMRTLNAVLILVFIPIFQAAVYPILSKCFEVTPLRKMVAGGWLAALAFVVAGIVQVQVNQTLPQLPDKSHSFVSFMNVWDSDCNLTVTPPDAGDKSTLVPTFLAANTSMIDVKGKSYSFHVNQGESEFQINYDGACTTKGSAKPSSVKYNFDGSKVYYVAIGPLGAISAEVATSKPRKGTGEFSFGITLMTDVSYDYNLALCRVKDGVDPDHPCNPQNLNDFVYWETDYDGHTDDRKDNITITENTNALTATAYAFKDVKPGKWRLYYLLNRPRDYDQRTFSKEDTNVTDMGIDHIEINGQGGVYSIIVTGPGDVNAAGLPTNSHAIHVYTVVQDNKLSILWQVPQFVILTAAEVLFSITGYEFAYSQSAPSMKSVVQALWLFTICIGDSIIVAVAIADPFTDLALEFFTYAGLMFLVICVFALISYFYYDYRSYAKDEEEESEEYGTDGIITVDSAETSYGGYDNYGGDDESDAAEAANKLRL